MRNLFVTAEMAKFQERARQNYANKIPDIIDPVFVGWNIHPGTVIVDEAKHAEIEITGNDNSGLVNVTVNGKAGQTTKQRIALVILTQNVTVYYGR